MNISGLDAPTALYAPEPPQSAPTKRPINAETNAPAAAPSTPAAAATDVSDHARVLSTLQSLSAAHPDKFKQAASAYADTLKTLAAQTGGAQGEHLTRLAQKFDEAGQSGKISVLQPPAAPAGAVQAAYARNSPQALRLPHAITPHGHAKGVKAPPRGITSPPRGIISPYAETSAGFPAMGLVSAETAAPNGVPAKGRLSSPTALPGGASSDARRLVPPQG